MSRRHFLKEVCDRKALRSIEAEPTLPNLLELLSLHVIDRFAAMSKADSQAVALGVCEPDEEEPFENPSHPACTAFAASCYCRESWQLHLEQLKHRPETHWGTCAHRRLCGIVPLVCRNRCPALVKLAGPASLDKDEFSRQLELLQLLVRDFAESHASFLIRVPGGLSIEATTRASSQPGEHEYQTCLPTHPQVIRALEYVSRHLNDPHLTVARVAAELEIYPTYLSQLFVEQIGQRMSRYITVQRLAKAKELLITTDWQIKRIAIETGFANPNWFSHVFARNTGLTPGRFRTETRRRRKGH